MASFHHTIIHQFLEKLGVHVRKLRNSPSGTSRWLYNDLLAQHSREHPGEAFTIFDIGANVGQTAYRFRHSFREARIFSFEPFPETFRQMQKNIGNLSGLRLENLGVGAEEGEIMVTLADESNPTSEINNLLAVHTGESGREAIPIKMTSVDAYCAKHGICRVNLLKSDTEGYEMAVFEGAKSMLSSRSIDAILVEVKPPQAVGDTSTAHVSQELVSAHLAPYGFEFWGLYDFIYSRATGRMDSANALYKLAGRPAA